MLSRRKFMTWLAGGAIVAPVAARTFFLPPSGGWISPHAQMIVPVSDIAPWAADIASGKFTYDATSEMLALWRLDERAPDPEPDPRWQVVDASPAFTKHKVIFESDKIRIEKIPRDPLAPKQVVFLGGRPDYYADWNEWAERKRRLD